MRGWARAGVTWAGKRVPGARKLAGPREPNGPSAQGRVSRGGSPSLGQLARKRVMACGSHLREVESVRHFLSAESAPAVNERLGPLG